MNNAPAIAAESEIVLKRFFIFFGFYFNYWAEVDEALRLWSIAELSLESPFIWELIELRSWSRAAFEESEGDVESPCSGEA